MYDLIGYILIIGLIILAINSNKKDSQDDDPYSVGYEPEKKSWWE